MLQSESYTPDISISYAEELQMNCNLLQLLNDYLVVVGDNLAYIGYDASVIATHTKTLN
jgi:hypothetical protein